MQIIASATNLRTSPRKLRLVADMIRKMEPDKAVTALKYTRKRAASSLAKVVKQALANATNNFKLNKSELQFKTVEINGGPTYKRFQAVSKGRAHSIMKRTSHIKIVLETKTAKTSKVEPKAAKPEVKKESHGTKSKS
jgi:large subunit ribosomal protein L22